MRFIQACPPALSEFQSHLSGKLSAAGYFEYLVQAASELQVVSFLSMLLCTAATYISWVDMGDRYIHASVGLYVSLRGDVAVAVVCR